MADLSKKKALDPFTYMEDFVHLCREQYGIYSVQLSELFLPQNERATLIEVDFPVSAGPLHTTMGHPEYNCNKKVIVTQKHSGP